jgi:hypothetical protein
VTFRLEEVYWHGFEWNLSTKKRSPRTGDSLGIEFKRASPLQMHTAEKRFAI